MFHARTCSLSRKGRAGERKRTRANFYCTGSDKSDFNHCFNWSVAFVLARCTMYVLKSILCGCWCGASLSCGTVRVWSIEETIATCSLWQVFSAASSYLCSHLAQIMQDLAQRDCRNCAASSEERCCADFAELCPIFIHQGHLFALKGHLRS